MIVLKDVSCARSASIVDSLIYREISSCNGAEAKRWRIPTSLFVNLHEMDHGLSDYRIG